jgi:cysteinyl-tRNA synthetase
MLKLFNSVTRKTEDFKPLHDQEVGFYACGPTVYDYAHIGNLRTMILNDVLRRTLEYDGYKVTEIMNITDVGHLTSDADTGDDKMEKNLSAGRQVPTADDVLAIAQKYEQAFYEDLNALNILPASKYPKASHHIQEHVDLIQKLIDKGFAYESDEAVYFDVSKFPNYNKLVGQNLDDMMLGARQEVVKDPKKKNPIDFVLWFKAVGRYANHILIWDSPWGAGFPGWHIECSSMSTKYLGQPFDIHTGGIDLKFPHHTNEIAQSEAANGAALANYWLHGEFLLLDNGKMAKSEGNFLTLTAVVDKGYNPLAYRYLALTSHYRSKLNFTWDSLTAAQNALNNLYSEISTYDKPGKILPGFEQSFREAINNDLETPQALATTFDMLKSDAETSDKLATLLKFDEVLGLKVREVWEAAKLVPETVQELVLQRQKAKEAKNFAEADKLRTAIESNGYIVEDTLDGSRLKKKF